MTYSKLRGLLTPVFACLVLSGVAALAQEASPKQYESLSSLTSANDSKVLGKNPGQIKGRWLAVRSTQSIQGYGSVFIGDVQSDIQWKNERNEAPIDEDLLNEKIQELLDQRLRESNVFGEILDGPPEQGASKGVVQLDCDLTVEPGSRAARWAVGFGAGKSRSILEIHMIDHATGEEIGRYHGYGVGSGMGLKLAGGGARKMTQDDIQENTLQFVELLAKVL